MQTDRLKTPEYYRARAVACERAGDAAFGTQDQVTMTYLANRWHKFADEAEAAREALKQSTPPNQRGIMATAVA